MKNPELARVFSKTKLDMERGYFINPDGEQRKFKGVKAMLGSTVRYEELSKDEGKDVYFENPRIYVQNIDTFEKAIEFGPDAACLNMASNTNRGGGVINGSMAQEECLCRRSNLYMSLERVDYPIPTLGGIYSPGVNIYKDKENNELPDIIKTNVISVSAVNRPTLMEDGLHVERRYIWMIKEKMRAILRIAKKHNHTKLVLGAFGCGAYKNPAGQTAELFATVLSEKEFKNSFEEICFAIVEDLNSKRLNNREGNLIPFARVFGLKED